MAVTSQSSVRSTRRTNTLLTDADADRDHPHSHLGKRPRNFTSTNGDYVLSKKPRAEKTLPARLRDVVRGGTQHHKQLSTDPTPHDGPLSTRGVRLTSAVQPPATGTITTNSQDTIDANGTLCNVSTQNSIPAEASKPTKEPEKRSLRSHDGGSRSRSELALYFPNYEEFISNEPKEAELLTAETRMFITEEAPKSPVSTKTFIHPSPTKPAATTPKTTPRKSRPSQISTKPSSPYTFSKIDLDALIPKLPSVPNNASDPLASPLFHKAHRRAERQEKQLKNIEKERAQHEKVQLERLYEGLRGPDWLRVMGISGVTDTERKGWEGKRAYFVREVGALIEKFRRWKEEERRRRLEKEIAQEEEEDGEEDVEEVDIISTGLSPASSDVDAMAARQLLSETLSASTSKSKGRSHRKKPSSKTGSKIASKQQDKAPSSLRSKAAVLAPSPVLVQRPITSFFAKPHQRAAALDRSRRVGRNRLAFGHPIPEMPTREFALPADVLTEEIIKASARSRRRARRGTGT